MVGTLLSGVVSALIALLIYNTQSTESRRQHGQTTERLDRSSMILERAAAHLDILNRQSALQLSMVGGLSRDLGQIVNTTPEQALRIDAMNKILEDIQSNTANLNGAVDLQSDIVDESAPSVGDATDEADDSSQQANPDDAANEVFPDDDSPSSVSEVTTSLLSQPPKLRDYKSDIVEDGCFDVEGSDQWCFFAGQATSYVAWRLNMVNFGGRDVFHNRYPDDQQVVWGHARDWDDAARRLDIEVDSTPAVGAVVQSDGTRPDSFGFLGYVEHVNYREDGGVESYIYSGMNFDSRANGTDPDTWMMRADVICPAEGCWPGTRFIHIRNLD